ncbi:MAG: response regulator [Magnetococcales bacterium]|nr:response regulator [Magnetococcales bacterium]
MNDKPPRSRILIVDDLPGNIKVLAELLKDEYDISMTTNGQDALRLAQGNTLELILLDIVMPGLDGFEVCRRLQADPRTHGIPVIFVTGQGDIEDEARGFANGAVDYITKPFSPPIVRARVKTQLVLKRARAQIERSNLEIRQLNDNLVAVLAEQKRANELLDRANQVIRATFGRYLSEDVVATLLDSPDSLRLGGERRAVTVMMSELRGFTLLSERHPPEEVVSMLNRYLEVMTEIIVHHQGTIIDFLGDGILALFGAPVGHPDDPERAVACALAMQLAMERVNAENRRRQFPEFKIGVGLNTGMVVAGNIGSDRRAKYGVVGGAINLTGRIESLALGGQILISDATALACGDILTIDRSWEVMPKGTGRPVRIHQVSGIGAPFSLRIPQVAPARLEPLIQPLKVRLRVMEGKQAEHEAALTGLAFPEAEVHSDLKVERLTNLRVELVGNGLELGPLYAKVLTEDEGDGRQRIHFTSTPEEAERFLRSLAGEAGEN